MRNLKVKIFLIIFLLSACPMRKPDSDLRENTSLEENLPVNVTLCDLVKSPDVYAKRKIRIKGIYVLRYHNPSFFSFACKSEKPIVLSYEKTKPCSKKNELDEWDWSSAMTDRAHGVVVIGKFNNEAKTVMKSYGKFEYFDFQVECFEKIKKLGWLSLVPTKEERQRIEEFEQTE